MGGPAGDRQRQPPGNQLDRPVEELLGRNVDRRLEAPSEDVRVISGVLFSLLQDELPAPIGRPVTSFGFLWIQEDRTCPTPRAESPLKVRELRINGHSLVIGSHNRHNTYKRQDGLDEPDGPKALTIRLVAKFGK